MPPKRNLSSIKSVRIANIDDLLSLASEEPGTIVEPPLPTIRDLLEAEGYRKLFVDTYHSQYITEEVGLAILDSGISLQEVIQLIEAGRGKDLSLLIGTEEIRKAYARDIEIDDSW